MELLMSIVLMFGARSISGLELRLMDIGLILIFIYVLISKKGKLKIHKEIICLALIKIVYTLLTLVFVGKFELGYILSLGYFLEFVITYIIVSNYEFDFKKIWKIGLIIAFASAGYSIVLYLLGVSGRIEGLLGAQSLCYILPFVLFTFVNDVSVTGEGNRKYWILSILSIITIILSWQRTLLIVATLGLLCLFIVDGQLKRIKPKTILYVVGIMVSIVLIWHFLPQGIKTVFTARLAEGMQLLSHSNNIEHRNSVTDRIVLWNAAGNLFLENPLFGIGSGAFARLSGNDFYSHVTLNLNASFSVEGLSTHNQLLENLCETGIIGTIITYSICFLIIRTFYKGINNKKDPYYIAILASLIALTIYDSIGQSTFYSFYNYIILIGYSYLKSISVDNYSRSIVKDYSDGK